MGDSPRERIEESIEARLAQLRTERDELRVRTHLAAAEVRDEWHTLEHRLEELEARLKAARREARSAAGDVGAALGLVADELREGFARIRARLDD